MEDANLVHLIYASAQAKPFSKDELLKLLESARKNNQQLSITGMLLNNDNNFFQILEGPKKNVDQLFEKIQDDNRHINIVKIIYEPISKRVFSDWSMGFMNVSQEQLLSIEGLNDFFKEGKCLVDLDVGRSKKLLQAFSKGFWRQSIS